MAYMFGFFFGKTPLIKLSPKKTWEGFIGGAVSTIIFGIGVSIKVISSIALSDKLGCLKIYPLEFISFEKKETYVSFDAFAHFLCAGGFSSCRMV